MTSSGGRPDGPTSVRFSKEPTSIEGLVLVRRTRRRDDRGEFTRLHCAEDFQELGILDRGFVQTNLSVTRRAGTVRGFHVLREPAREHKLVTCVAGSAWDVALDLREGSSTYRRTFAVELSERDDVAVLIPPGVAHAFQALKPDTVLLYQHSDFYRQELDAGVDALDPAVDARWPLEVTARSDRDRALPPLEEIAERRLGP